MQLEMLWELYNNLQNTSDQDPMTVLTEKKKLLDAGLITQEDYDKLKAQILGL